MSKWYTYLFLFYSGLVFSQKTVICRVDSLSPKSINIKWYFPNLINLEGYNVYRKDSAGSSWKKLNASPIQFKSHKINEQELANDKELKNYMSLASRPENVKDLALLAILIKSFKSISFSKYLGIWYDDTSVEKGKSYQYKITLLDKQTDLDSALSPFIHSKNYIAIDAPKDIQFKTGNKKVSFTWLAETDRYFGVNIYRQTEENPVRTKLTKDPILLSKTKNKNGEETFGTEYFVDSKLLPHTKYQYTFEAIDFFGSPSKPSAPIQVVLKDLDPPQAPDSIYHQVIGRKVTVQWKKRLIENDLKGFNVYRTNLSDTDFVKLNFIPIKKDQFQYVDTVSHFGSFMYAISCVDNDQNEVISNPYFVEAYDNEAPAPPKNLIIQSDTGRLVLQWNKNIETDLKGYLIYRTTNKNNEDAYVKITPNPIASNFYIDSLSKNIKTAFLYKVVAVDESLNRSSYSEFASARMPDVIPPQAPFLKTAFLNSKKSIQIEWFLNAEHDMLAYNLFRKEIHDTTNSAKKINIKPISKSVFRYSDRNFINGNVYDYYLQAIDSAGNISNSSNVIRVKTKELKETEEIAITSFDAKYNSKKNCVELKWKLKNDFDIKAMLVFRKKQGESILTPFNGYIEKDKLTDKEIVKGEYYTYQLRVYNQSGDVIRSKLLTLEAALNK